MKKLALRILALVVYNMATVVGSSAALGGQSIGKATLTALAPVLPVIAMLARSYYQDGKLTQKETDIALGGPDA